MQLGSTSFFFKESWMMKDSHCKTFLSKIWFKIHIINAVKEEVLRKEHSRQINKSQSFRKNEWCSFHFGSVQLLHFFLLNSYTNSSGIMRFRPLREHFSHSNVQDLIFKPTGHCSTPRRQRYLVVCSIWIGRYVYPFGITLKTVTTHTSINQTKKKLKKKKKKQP